MIAGMPAWDFFNIYIVWPIPVLIALYMALQPEEHKEEDEFKD